MSKSRLTIVEAVVHQGDGDHATAAESRYSVALASDEQPYVRRCTVGEAWQPLDCGWLDSASCLVLANEEGKGLQVNPTAEEKQATAAKVVELAVGSSADDWFAFALVPPGESARFRPAPPSTLLIRCRQGTARVTIYLFPA